MSINNIEVELKVKIDEYKFAELKERISKIGIFVRSSSQVDEYFTPPDRDFVKPTFPYEWLSIRERDGIFVLNYKHFYPENVPITDYCDEFEAKTTDGDDLRKILSALGFRRLVTVRKGREVYTYDDKFEISLDIVDELGLFVEIEALKDFGSITITRERLCSFAEVLGVDVSKNDNRGYPFLLMEKKGLLTL